MPKSSQLGTFHKKEHGFRSKLLADNKATHRVPDSRNPAKKTLFGCLLLQSISLVRYPISFKPLALL